MEPEAWAKAREQLAKVTPATTPAAYNLTSKATANYANYQFTPQWPAYPPAYPK
jgi:hypothetical protein